MLGKTVARSFLKRQVEEEVPPLKEIDCTQEDRSLPRRIIVKAQKNSA
jgi:hypothetical protein